MKPFPSQKKANRLRRVPVWFWLAVVIMTGWVYLTGQKNAKVPEFVPTVMAPTQAPTKTPSRPSYLLGVDAIKPFNQTQTLALAKENYGAATLPVATGITKYTFHYRSKLETGEDITVYGRAYLPDAPASNLPVFAFAPGTTGIGDICAPSLEQPQKANWANYDSHMAMYASQGFAAVTTDYEGMRDPGRIHHYMVGELEGRALLDAIRALRELPQAKDRLSSANVFVGGYSQGGHAAFWADKIAATYAPDVKLKGVVGFGPVMSVKQTLADVTRAANINWFGPYVLLSYRDYYHADYGPVLLQHWNDTLAADVPAHCIDTNLPFWGYTPHNVYTPEFIQAMSSGDYTAFAGFSRDLDANAVGATATNTAKRINQGVHDNVVLPSQQQALAPQMCAASKGPFQLIEYPHATHYNTMLQSLTDTLEWMRTIMKDGKIYSTCPGVN